MTANFTHYKLNIFNNNNNNLFVFVATVFVDKISHYKSSKIQKLKYTYIYKNEKKEKTRKHS